MERVPVNPEEIRTEITQTDDGVDITTARRNVWHFTDEESARRYFRRRRLQFNTLRWGLRGIVVAGALRVAFEAGTAIQTHDVFSGAGALITGGLVLAVQVLNQQRVGERVRLHGEVVRRLAERFHHDE